MSNSNGARVAIITVAGISSRFNEGIDEERKILKAIYSDGDVKKTLLSHLIGQCGYADRIIIVGGYKFDDLKEYVGHTLPAPLREKTELVENEHYSDLASGYSLYLGLEAAFKEKDIRDILFVEGDLDIDDDSFQSVVSSKKTVLTYTDEMIVASKSVVFYKNVSDKFRYAFNSRHGLLTVSEPFSVILNSGQLWKFTDPDALQKANDEFFNDDKGGTNLSIIQKYLDAVPSSDVEIIKLSEWTNCNTREDYKKIKESWEKTK